MAHHGPGLSLPVVRMLTCCRGISPDDILRQPASGYAIRIAAVRILACAVRILACAVLLPACAVHIPVAVALRIADEPPHLYAWPPPACVVSPLACGAAPPLAGASPLPACVVPPPTCAAAPPLAGASLPLACDTHRAIGSLRSDGPQSPLYYVRSSRNPSPNRMNTSLSLRKLQSPICFF
jgi:hypothetical protein